MSSNHQPGLVLHILLLDIEDHMHRSKLSSFTAVTLVVGRMKLENKEMFEPNHFFKDCFGPLGVLVLSVKQ